MNTIQNIEKELDELAVKIKQLNEFIVLQETLSSNERSINKTEYSMLKVQQQAMETYAYILAARLEYINNQ